MEIKANQEAILKRMGELNAQAAGKNPKTKAEDKLDFSKLLVDNVNKVNNLQQVGKSVQQRYELGDKSVELHDVMIKQQTASISFQTLLQTRNRLVSAYQEITGMQL